MPAQPISGNQINRRWYTAGGIGLVITAALIGNTILSGKNPAGIETFHTDGAGNVFASGTVLIGSGAVKTSIQNGSISGSHLNLLGTIAGAGLTDCDADTQALSWDASTKQFICGDDDNSGTGGGGNWSNTGSLKTFFDTKYVDVAGDTMTGALTINVTGGSKTTLGLNVLNTLSGAVHVAGHGSATVPSYTFANDLNTGLYRIGADIIGFAAGGSEKLKIHNAGGSNEVEVTGDGLLVSGGNFRVNGGDARFDGGFVKIGDNVTAETALEVLGTISGSSLYGTTITGLGLTDCDGDAQTLAWDATTGRFGCGDDDSGGTGGGISVTDADLRYVNTFGDTMTGALTINVTGGTDTTLGLRVLNAISGSLIHAEKGLTSSGNLVVKNGITASGAKIIMGNGTTSSLKILDSSLRNSLVFSNSATQNMFSVKQADSDFERNAVLMVSNTGATLSSVLTVNKPGTSQAGFQATSSLYYSTMLTNAKLGQSEPANAVRNFADGQYYSYMDGSGGLVLNNQQIFDPEIRFASSGNANMFMVDSLNNRVGIGQSAPDTTFDVLGTISGSILHASTQLRSSGSLITESGAYIDGTTLVVQANSNRVGIGTAAPETAFNVSGITRFGMSAGGAGETQLFSTTGGNYLRTYSSAGSTFDIDYVGGTAANIVYSTDWKIGVGTTPETVLDVLGTISGSRLTISNNASISGALIVKNSMSGGSLSVDGNETIQKIVTGSATFDFPSIAGDCTSTTVTVPGAAVGDYAVLTLPSTAYPSDAFFPTPQVTAANTVTIKLCTISLSYNAASATYRVMVFTR
jgi:hypothetical protein